MSAPATMPRLGALGALAACQAASPRRSGALAGIADIIIGVTSAVTGVVTGMQERQQSDTDRFWAGAADTRYSRWLDYWTRTGRLPEHDCSGFDREGRPWCERAWQRFLVMTGAGQQLSLRTFATPEVIVAGILFVLAVRASGRP